MARVWLNAQEEAGFVSEEHQPYLEKILTEDDFANKGMGSMDSDHLTELLNTTETGVLQLAHLVMHWEKRNDNMLVLLRQQLDALDQQRHQAERKYRAILEGDETTWTTETNEANGTSVDSLDSPRSPLTEDEHGSFPSVETGSGYSSVDNVNNFSWEDLETSNALEFWKARCEKTELLLKESLRRERILLNKLRDEKGPPAPAVPFAEIQDSLNRFDNFLHFALRKAPIVIGHQDAELRHKFVYNMYPGLQEEEILGKTDVEIHLGAGMVECMEWKREVLKKGKPMQREFDVYSDLVGHRTFLMTVIPIINKSGEAMGLNYLALDITEGAVKREHFIVLREEVAVQKSLETELQKTLVLTEEAMRAKQILATMAHEIRSPLSGVVSVSQLLGTTRLDSEQRPMVELLNTSGDHVLELINDILDLSKVESGGMRLEAKKFRPRQMIKRILQLALATIHKKDLSLAGNVSNDVPYEVVGDVLRIRQVLMNLVSNAVKFTARGEIKITLRLIPPPISEKEHVLCVPLPSTAEDAVLSPFHSDRELDSQPVTFPNKDEQDETLPPNSSLLSSSPSNSSLNSSFSSTSGLSTTAAEVAEEVVQNEEEQGPNFPDAALDEPLQSSDEPDKIWLHFEVSDTGIGIPEAALPSLFEKYTQASLTTARKYGGTGLGLAICEQLVALMGGTLEVKSTLYVGSSFSFALPLRAVKAGTSRVPLIEADTRRAAVLPAREPDPEVKGVQSAQSAVDGKLKQMLRDPRRSWVAAIGEGSLLGRIKSSAERFLPDLRESKGGPPPCPPGGDVTSLTDSTAKTGEKRNDRRLGGSSTFYLKLDSGGKNRNKITPPACTPPAPPVGLSRTSSNAKNLPNAPRILLADDNSINIVVAKSMLKKFGHSPEVVNTGKDAVEAVQRGDFDLILMDCSMPVMDGLEATRTIREFEKRRDMKLENQSDDAIPPIQPMGPDSPSRPAFKRRVPIIALTADVLPENVAKCHENGMDSFLSKPITFEKLEQVLQQYIPWSIHLRQDKSR